MADYEYEKVIVKVVDESTKGHTVVIREFESADVDIEDGMLCVTYMPMHKECQAVFPLSRVVNVSTTRWEDA